MLCTYCGAPIKGEVVAPGWEAPLIGWDEDGEYVLDTEHELGFCSERCAWGFGVEWHKAWASWYLTWPRQDIGSLPG